MKVKKIISIVLFCVSIAMITGGVILMNSKQYIFSTAMAKTFGNIINSKEGFINNYLVKDLENINKYKITIDNKITYNNEELLNLTGDIYKDLNSYYFNVNSNQNENSISLEALIKNSKLYYRVKDVMEEFYYFDFDFNMEETITDEDINLIIKHIKNGVINSFGDKDIDKVKTVLEIDGLKFNTNKLSITLNESKLLRILINVFKEISKDNDAIKVFQKINKDITKQQIEEGIKEIEDELNGFDDKEMEDLFTLSIYVNVSNNPIRTEIVLGGNDSPDSVASQTISLIYDSYNNKTNNKTNSLTLLMNASVFIELKEEQTSKNNSNITLEINNFEDNQPVIEIVGSKTKDSSSVSLHLDLNSQGVNLGNIEYNLKTISKAKEYNLGLTIKLYIDEETLAFISDNNIYCNENMPNIDVSNAKNNNEINTDDQQAISDYLEGIYSTLDNNSTNSNEDVEFVKEAGIDYFNDNGLPDSNESESITLKDLIDNYYLISLQDEYDLDNSYIEISNYLDEYSMTIYLINDSDILMQSFDLESCFVGVCES